MGNYSYILLFASCPAPVPLYLLFAVLKRYDVFSKTRDGCYNGIAYESCLGKSLGNSYRLIYKPKEMLLVRPIMKLLFE